MPAAPSIRILFFTAASLASLIGFLLVGLWPFDFSPDNEAVWKPDGGGLFFNGRRTSWKRSVGSLAFLGPLKGPAGRPPAKAGAFSLAIRLEPESETTEGLDQFLNIVDASGTAVLSLGQWQTTLIIRWRDAVPAAGGKWQRTGIGKALIKGRPRWVTIATSDAGTEVSIDGQLAVRLPGTLPPARNGEIRGSRILLGNSPETDSPWTGTLYTLAVYENSMPARILIEDGDRSPPFREGLLAAFDLGNRAENPSRDLSGNGNGLDVPAHINVRPRILKRADFSVQTRSSIAKDVTINIAGFLPFGFFFMGLLENTGRRSRRLNMILSVFAGISISLLIEMIQGFIPARDSSPVDVLCNSAGALLGMTAYLLFSFVAPAIGTRRG